MRKLLKNYYNSLLPWRLRGKEFTCQWRNHRFSPWVGKIPWRREWLCIPVFLHGESHGQRSLASYSPWCRKEFVSLWIWLFQLPHISGIIQYLSFCDWLIPLSLIHPQLINEHMSKCFSFLRLLLHFLYVPHFIYPFIYQFTLGLPPHFRHSTLL